MVGDTKTGTKSFPSIQQVHLKTWHSLCYETTQIPLHLNHSFDNGEKNGSNLNRIIASNCIVACSQIYCGFRVKFYSKSMNVWWVCHLLLEFFFSTTSYWIWLDGLQGPNQYLWKQFNSINLDFSNPCITMNYRDSTTTAIMTGGKTPLNPVWWI